MRVATWRDAAGARRMRWGVLALVALLHLALGWLLHGETSPRPRAKGDPTRIELTLIAPDAPVPGVRPPDPADAPATPVALRASSIVAPAPSREMAVSEAVPAPARRRVYRPDGALDLPDNLLDAIDSVAEDAVEYRIANLDKAGMFLRPPPIDYEPTVFDAYWVPAEDLLEEWVRKGIQEVSIPIPGSGWRLVCKVSLLALGGGCGIRQPVQSSTPRGFGPYVPPPNRNR